MRVDDELMLYFTILPQSDLALDVRAMVAWSAGGGGTQQFNLTETTGKGRKAD